jgi:hypothetical protein
MRFPWQPSPPSEHEVVAEFVEFLRQKWAHIQVQEFTAEYIEYLHLEDSRQEATSNRLYLHKMHETIDGLSRSNAKTRWKVYEQFAQRMLTGESLIPDVDDYDSAQTAPRIFPRLVRAERPAVWQREANEELPPPQRPLANTPYVVSYVLDCDTQVMYVTARQSELLKMDEKLLYDYAVENTRKLFSREQFRSAIEELPLRKAVAFSCPDAHASARLLVLPEYMEEGEEISVVVGDNDTFLMGLLPSGNNWNSLRELAREGGRPYLHHPFLVTREGIKAM